MITESISPARQAALPEWIVIPSAVEGCREPSENPRSGDALVEEYMPMPTTEPLWPRVFPGL
jgi:hypothetical protein